ncbi:MAG TPA: CDP-alcohol phosphatidyltransferase family protein, partial [Hyphomicrobiaceae bacterium]|nr:CDP-alcohol phosphatidyltransferase family protein [Hyphomicrobiaceae bacterium]
MDRLTIPVAAVLARQGIGANAVSIGGAVLGLAGAVAIAAGAPLAGLVLFILGRISDGLDGAVARASGTGPTDWGGFLDIVLDFLVYAAIPLAFAMLDPGSNGVAAALLLASFLANGSAFLAFATIAAKRGLST